MPEDGEGPRTFDLSKFQVTRPCPHCPFRTDGRPIRFGDRERAEEIEEQAYRRGFPCHETAECPSDPNTGDEGFVFGKTTSHCIGYVILRLKADGGAAWPGVGNDDDLLEAVSEELGDWTNVPVFDDEEAFLKANEKGRGTKRPQAAETGRPSAGTLPE